MNTKDTELIYEAYSRSIVERPAPPEYIIKENIVILNAALDIVEEQMGPSKMQTKSSEALDTIQTALDVAGIEPTIGTAADIGNGLISLFRAAMAKESDQRKKHLLNAAISAVSVIPGGDIAKALKAHKITRPLAKVAIKGAKLARNFRQGRAKAGAAELARRFIPQPGR